jgi:hypothetical protein
MSATHAPADDQPETLGTVILLFVSGLSALLVILGLVYAAGTGARMEANLFQQGCEPGLSSDAFACITQPQLAAEYKAVLDPAAQQMNVATVAYTADETHNLAAAEAALTSQVTTEQAFDTSLAAITFPPAMTPIARAIINADQALATLTAKQAKATTLARMRSYNPRIQADTAVVETQMNLLLKAIDVPVKLGKVG